MLPGLEKLVRLIFKSSAGPTKGTEPERWRIEFRSLYQPTEQETATTRKIVADTDVAYINAGVLYPEEVAASAFGGSKFSSERQIDWEGREKMAADEEARAKEMQSAEAEDPELDVLLNDPDEDLDDDPEEFEPEEKPTEKPEKEAAIDHIDAISKLASAMVDARRAGVEIDVSAQLAEHGAVVKGKVE